MRITCSSNIFIYFNCLRGRTVNVLGCHVEVLGSIPGPHFVAVYVYIHGTRGSGFPQCVIIINSNTFHW